MMPSFKGRGGRCKGFSVNYFLPALIIDYWDL